MSISEDFVIRDGILKKYTGTAKDIIIPDCVEYIDNSAFENCKTAETLLLPDNIAEIGQNAFAGCSELVSVTFRESPLKIRDGVFAGCPKLSRIQMSSRRGSYTVLRNCLIHKRTKTLVSGCQSSVIPDGGEVTKIAPRAFEGCSSLSVITVPKGVTSVGDGAFAGCTGLSDIKLADTVTYIGKRAFEGCISLKKAVIPPYLEKLSALTFHGCTEICEADIPEGVAEISGNPFTACPKLKKLTVSKNNRYYHSRGNCIIHTADSTVIAGCKSSVIPEGTKAVGELAFSYCTGLKAAVLPRSLERIEKGAFSGCSGLESVAVPGKVSVIGETAFADCESLAEIVIEGNPRLMRDSLGALCKAVIYAPGMTVPNLRGYEERAIAGMCSLYGTDRQYAPAVIKSYISYIRKNRNRFCPAAYSDRSLLSFMIREKLFDREWAAVLRDRADSEGNIELKAIFIDYLAKQSLDLAGGDGAMSAFELDFSPEDIYSPKSVSELKKDWKFEKKQDGTVKLTLYTGSDREVFVPESFGRSPVSEIGDGAFAGYADMISVTIPGSVKRLGRKAFIGCRELGRVKLSHGLRSIGEECFAECENLSEITLPEGISELLSRAFDGCRALDCVLLPASLSKLGDNPFRRCTGLCSLTADSENPVYFSKDGCVIEKRTRTLVCAAMGAKIPEDGTVTAIGQAFEANTEIRGIDLPDCITYIECNAFDGCTGLEHVRLPKKLAELPAFVFCDCKKLRTVDIPESVSVFGILPFDGCENVVLRVRKNSAALSYAKENGIAFTEV